MMYSYFIISGIIKKFVMPPLGRLTAVESELEGSYRTAHQVCSDNYDMIGFLLSKMYFGYHYLYLSIYCIYLSTRQQRIISNSEEIAFYDGSQKEKQIINQLFDGIFNHSSYVHYLKCLIGSKCLPSLSFPQSLCSSGCSNWWTVCFPISFIFIVSVFDGLLVKYWATIVGYAGNIL